LSENFQVINIQEVDREEKLYLACIQMKIYRTTLIHHRVTLKQI